MDALASGASGVIADQKRLDLDVQLKAIFNENKEVSTKLLQRKLIFEEKKRDNHKYFCYKKNDKSNRYYANEEILPNYNMDYWHAVSCILFCQRNL